MYKCRRGRGKGEGADIAGRATRDEEEGGVEEEEDGEPGDAGEGEVGGDLFGVL